MTHLNRIPWCIVLTLAACAKHDPKPMRTEPWLAHPASSAAPDAAAALSAVHYRVGERSVIRFEVPRSRHAFQGRVSQVSGAITLFPADLSRSQATIEGNLKSLTVQTGDADEQADRTARVQSALQVSDGAAPTALSRFELTSLEDVSPTQLEPTSGTDSARPQIRRGRGVAVGALLLHGFRVERRVPIEVEFGFVPSRTAPTSLVIRSRAPLVVSLDTHDIVPVLPREHGPKAPAKSRQAPPEVLVSIELYATISTD